MRRVIKVIGLILMGVILCIAIQIGIRAYNAYRMMTSGLGWPHPGAMSQEDLHAWTEVGDAMRGCDVKAVNDILLVKPGEIELTVMMCPLYPEGCTPIAEISMKNVSSRKLVVFDPWVRTSGPSRQHDGRWTEDYDVSCGISSGTRWCRVLAPQQVLALPPEKLEVDGPGLHRVSFSARFPVFKSISRRDSEASLPEIAKASRTFMLKGNRPARTDTAMEVSTNGFVRHVVGRNQDLQSIAMMYGVDAEILKRVNGIKGDALRVGQELKIPEPK